MIVSRRPLAIESSQRDEFLRQAGLVAATVIYHHDICVILLFLGVGWTELVVFSSEYHGLVFQLLLALVMMAILELMVGVALDTYIVLVMHGVRWLRITARLEG